MMESENYITSDNHKELTFTPELKRITKLNDFKEIKIVKSPSWPSSPAVSRSDVRQDITSQFWTLGKKAFATKSAGDENSEYSFQQEISRQQAIKEIHSILAGMDLGKYYVRKPRNTRNHSLDSIHQQPLRRCQSVQPQMTSSYSSFDVSFLSNIPSPPKTQTIIELLNETSLGENVVSPQEKQYSLELTPIKNSRKSVNPKLKELTEKLRSSSAPPSPHRKPKYTVPQSAPPTSNFSFWTDSLSNTENTWGIMSDKETKNNYSEDDFEKDTETCTKLKSVPKSLKKKTSSLSGCATLPRTKGIANKENHNEPRTLASLDLNINFDVFRNNRSSLDEDTGPSKECKDNFKDSDKKERRKEECNRISNENFRKSSYEDNSTGRRSHSSSRRNSLKNNVVHHRADFDLNFVKYGSLNSQDKRVERRKSIGKIDIQTDDEAKRRTISTQEYTNAEASDKLRLEMSSEVNANNSSEENKNFTTQSYIVDETKSVPVLPATSSNPLEEEIRTIAKLLNGKESLFLKLIQSSSLKDETQTDEVTTDRPFSPPLSNERYCSRDMTPLLNRKSATLPNTGRSSPNRSRSMTVSGTESSKTEIASPPMQQKRFYKRRLRGPYGEMLEQEMSKSVNKPRPSYAKDLDFLKELASQDSSSEPPISKSEPTRSRPLLRSSSHSLDETHTVTVDGVPKRKTSANLPVMSDSEGDKNLCVPAIPFTGTVSEPTLHIRSHSDSVKTSTSWNTDLILNKVLKQSSQQDTRTHIVSELYETEMSYVESLQIILRKYMIPLKSSEHSTEIDSDQVDRIFWQVPELLKFHESFLDIMANRLGYWDTKQKIGDIFVDVFTRPEVVDTYIEFINNWKAARDSVKSISSAKPAFAKFLENTSREHKGKLTLDALLIMPVQRIPRYELLIKELLKHTPMDHPDYKLLLQAQREVHDLAVKINKVEREAMLLEQRIQKLKEVEQLIDGVTDLVQGDREFIRHDHVQIPGGLGMKKERCLFLFSDMLLITSIKKKGAIRKSSVAVNAAALYHSLDTNKYKLLLKASLQDVELLKNDVEEPCVRKYLKEISTLESDVTSLEKINEIIGTLSFKAQNLEVAVKDYLSNLSYQLVEKRESGSQLMSVELEIRINNEEENFAVLFSTPEQRMTWEAAFLDAKDNIREESMYPEFLSSLPLGRTRPGMQITCAASIVGSSQSGLPDLWICSSDGYVGQVCILSYQAEPVIATCANVCSARILCIAAVPGVNAGYLRMRRRSTLLPYLPGFNYEKMRRDSIQECKGPLDSDSDDEFIDALEEELSSDDTNTLQPTIWLGTEDGCIYIYNCKDVNLRKTRLKMHHTTCIYDIIHFNEKVYVSLANGEILIYRRDISGTWNTFNPHRMEAATNVSPISKMILVEEKLWCATLNSIAVIGTSSLEVEITFPVGPELMRHVTAIARSGYGVWVAVQSSPIIHLYHITTYHHLMEINITSAVTKMLNAYDEIIRQHKLVCLRVTSLSVESDTLWIGTSAGIILNLPIPSISPSTTHIESIPNINGLRHGHVGHVRFLVNIKETSVESSLMNEARSCDEVRPRNALPSNSETPSAFMISGGDGYEHFKSSSTTDVIGCDDSTSHILMWKM
ncbi:rho guanine nucleotide exchange factor 17-like [Parasteatoda tepidariorum]|uniref:rho guanine nucleotide exchange factor 17-like n=1 Tax=Parasteatoda tepidariorum TaxID=114398 RepID=UPI001C71E418|nr:rho guanine nucleotide exchange factor 17-like isoform X2 [Parasteatoda tepidariorum]